MFENISDKLQDTFKNLTGRGKLTESNIEDAMRDVRLALLEADVNYKIVKEFVDEVKSECLGERVMKSITPGQQAIKIVNDHLVQLMGESNVALDLSAKPSIILMVGLQGGGKTTTTAKLAHHLQKEGKSILMVAADVYRPAAIDQLEFLGRDLNIPVYSNKGTSNVTGIATTALAAAHRDNVDVMLVDTAGRLQIDQDLIQELKNLKQHLNPAEILLIADTALGQEAVSVASHFNDALNLTGIVLTKMDSDAHGGAALSMRKVTGKPIKFVGVGEKTQDFEPFYPDRMASRILGMGDVVSLVEKAAETISEEEAKKLEQKMLKKKYDFNDFLSQLGQMKKLGGLGTILDMMPGGKKLKDAVNIDDNMLTHIEAILSSMTPYERNHPDVLKEMSRKKRIAKGSGRPVDDVQQLLKRFDMMKSMVSNHKKFPGMLGGGSGQYNSIKSSGQQSKTMSQKAKKAKRKKHKKKR